MPSKNPAQRLSDIIDNIAAIESFVAGIEFDAFRSDRRTVYAVTRALEIVSEASRRLPEELIQQHPEINWAAIRAAGNVYRHEYDAVDEALIWHTIKHDLASLRRVCEAEFRGTKPD